MMWEDLLILRNLEFSKLKPAWGKLSQAVLHRVSQQSISRSLWSSHINSSRPWFHAEYFKEICYLIFNCLKHTETFSSREAGSSPFEAWPCPWQMETLGGLFKLPQSQLLRLQNEAVNIHLLEGLRFNSCFHGWWPWHWASHKVGAQQCIPLSPAPAWTESLKAVKLLLSCSRFGLGMAGLYRMSYWF